MVKLPLPQTTQTAEVVEPVRVAYLPAAQGVQEIDPVLRRH